MERTLVLCKPDAVQRNLVGEILNRLESRGLKIVGAKFIQVTRELAEAHYAVHKGKSFYENLIQYITSAPVMAIVFEGPQAIAAVRQTMGSTKPLEAAQGSIRHDFGLTIGRNLTHASDSLENAEKEISLWFKPDEVITWTRPLDSWIFQDN
ncbi:MAG TPA: nucleoside-diphosphate kinase [Bellilinea sp.]|nr:nucleoside-diphosphate kinase [Bellilinea sp.]